MVIYDIKDKVSFLIVTSNFIDCITKYLHLDSGQTLKN